MEKFGKKNILLTKSGNRAIFLALKMAKKINNNLVIADQGGWYTYSQYGKKLKFDVTELKTDNGIIDFEELKNCVVLFNIMPAYAFNQEYNYEKLKENNVFTIVDITAKPEKAEGDILVCSFGENKIIDLGYGGMLATDFEIPFDSDFEGNEEDLNEKINAFPNRIKLLKEKRKEVLKDLNNYDIIKKEHDGINVIVKFKDEKEKNEIIDYCDSNNLKYKICPLKIKVLEPAVSIQLTQSI